MIKKVLLINPANTIHADSIRRLGTPLGLLYIAAVLWDDFQVKIIDSPCDGYYNCHLTDDKQYITYGLSDDDLAEQIRNYSPDIVGVSCLFTSRERNTLHTCGVVTSVNPDIPIVLGGLHPSLFAKEMLMTGIVDFVVLGEGEVRFRSLLDALNKNKIPDFDGIAYLVDGTPVVNPIQNQIPDLDSIPFPARHLVDMEKYINICVPYAPFPKEERVEQILTSRGCIFHCNFCSSVGYWGRQLRTRSVDNISREIEELVSKYGIKELQLVDDNITLNRQHAMELFTRLKDFNISWCTPNGLMPTFLDEEMIQLMNQSGAYQLTFAIESGSERVLKEIIHKPVPSMKKVKKLVDTARYYGIQVHSMFVVGFPGETREEIMATLDYPFKVGFDSASFFVAVPLPGSELYYYCRDKGYLPTNYDSMEFKSASIIIPKDSPDYAIDPDELIELVDLRTKEFNEFSKARDPQAWDNKFKVFLSRHPNDADMILGRVT